MEKIKHPFYEAEIKTSRCGIELSVNDVPAFLNFDEGTMAVDWPINQFILDSGEQYFEIKILPFKNTVKVSPKAKVELRIYLSEGIDDDVPRQLISEEILIDLSDKKNLPIYIYKGNFNAVVKYNNEGWKNSIDLLKENEKVLFDELKQWNEKLLNIYKTANITEYIKVFGERKIEFGRSSYIPDRDALQMNINLSNSNFKNLIIIPSDLYKLVFAGNGKMVSFKLPYELPGFTYEPKVKVEKNIGITLLVLFHRKKKGDPLTIIR